MSSLDRRRLALASYLLAALIFVIAFVFGHADFLNTKRSVLLILGGDLVVLGAALTAPSLAEGWQRDLPIHLVRVLTEAIFGAALVSAGTVILFGNIKPVERLGFFAIALVVVPASVVVALRSDNDEPECAWFAVIVSLVATILAICVARLSTDYTVSGRLFILLIAGRLIATQCARLGYKLPRWRGEAGDAAYAAAVAVLLAIGAFVFVPSPSVTVVHVLFALAAAAAIALLWTRVRSVPLPLRVGIDVVAVVLIAMGIFELFPVQQIRELNVAYFLGPANDVLHGRPMLVDTYSQYGVGAFDALAGLFKIIPLGYGVFTLVLATATACLYVCMYAVLRLSIRSQLIAVMGLVVAAVINVYGQPAGYSYLDFPSIGVMRFGLPWLVLLLALLAARTGSARRARLAGRALIVLVGCAAVWSGETGTYCFGTAVVIALVDSAALPLPLRSRAVIAVRRLLALAAAAAVGVVLFTAVTWITAGSEPHWGPYLAFVQQYTTGGLGALDMSPWTPGLALGGLYAGSAAVILALAIARPDVIRGRLATFQALGGLTALGVLTYTYFLGRSHPDNLLHISPPAVALVFVWLGVAQSAFNVRRVVAGVIVLSVVFVGALAVAGEYSTARPKFAWSLLGALLEQPGNLGLAWSELADNSGIAYPQTTELAEFVRSLHVGDRPIAMLAYPAVQTEALFRLGRTTDVNSSQPCQDDISATGADRALSDVKALRTGGLVVTYFSKTLPLNYDQVYTLTAIQHRFTLHRIASRNGAVEYRLGAQKRTWKGGGSIPQPAYGLDATGCG